MNVTVNGFCHNRFFILKKGGFKMNLEQSDPQYLYALEEAAGLRNEDGVLCENQLHQRINHPKLIKWFKEKSKRSSYKRFVLGVKIFGLSDLVITEESDYLPDILREYERTPVNHNCSPRLIFDQESGKILMTQNDQMIYETLLLIYSEKWWIKKNPLASNYHNWHWRSYPVLFKRS